MKRRSFIKQLGAGSLLLGAGGFPLEALGSTETTRLVILHTNDVHSRIDPFPMDGGRNQGLGGAARRAALIDEVRRTEDLVLLLDAGDSFQGTPYFNCCCGELEFKLMSTMKYDAATIGNHDFDAGLEGLHKQLPHADFPFLIANYDFSDTIMADKTEPYRIFEKGPVRIGVFGLGIELAGMVPDNLYGNTRYLDPIAAADKYATLLKQEHKCDYVICLSHLGYQYRGNKVSDVVLAKNSEHIDLIIGGHTHTFMDRPEQLENRAGEAVIINQVGWAGIMLGRLDVYFERRRKKNCVDCRNILVN